jgi:hypothetical protein
MVAPKTCVTVPCLLVREACEMTRLGSRGPELADFRDASCAKIDPENE